MMFACTFDTFMISLLFLLCVVCTRPSSDAPQFVLVKFPTLNIGKNLFSQNLITKRCNEPMTYHLSDVKPIYVVIPEVKCVGVDSL